MSLRVSTACAPDLGLFGAHVLEGPDHHSRAG